MMMEGIDESFDAALLVGYHASTANPEGVRAHTMSSGNLTGVVETFDLAGTLDRGVIVAQDQLETK